MSTAEILSFVSLISYIAAGVCFLLAVFFWFFFKIPSVIGDLTGRTARKSIEKIRRSNEQSGNKSYRTGETNAARGKLTNTMQHTKQPMQEQRSAFGETPETGLISDSNASAHFSEYTTPLNDGGTTALLTDEAATTALNVESPASSRPGGKKLTMINEVILIHTNEVI